MKNKIGIFGGTFDPIHEGHINSIKTVQKKFSLDKVYVVPNYQNPLKEKPQLSLQKRLNLIKKALAPLDKIVIDEQEIQKKHITFSIDTIKNITKSHFETEFFFILGADVFNTFPKWRQFEEILNLVHLVVTSRPGWPLMKSKQDIPLALQKIVKTYDQEKGFALLETQKKIFFVPLKNISVSSTEIRSISGKTSN